MMLKDYLKENITEHLSPDVHWVAQDGTGDICTFTDNPSYIALAEQWTDSKEGDSYFSSMLFEAVPLCDDYLEALHITPEIRRELHSLL